MNRLAFRSFQSSVGRVLKSWICHSDIVLEICWVNLNQQLKQNSTKINQKLVTRMTHING